MSAAKLTLKIPWKNLYTEPAVIQIQGIYALVIRNQGKVLILECIVMMLSDCIVCLICCLWQSRSANFWWKVELHLLFIILIISGDCYSLITFIGRTKHWKWTLWVTWLFWEVWFANLIGGWVKSKMKEQYKQSGKLLRYITNERNDLEVYIVNFQYGDGTSWWWYNTHLLPDG